MRLADLEAAEPAILIWYGRALPAPLIGLALDWRAKMLGPAQSPPQKQLTLQRFIEVKATHPGMRQILEFAWGDLRFHELQPYRQAFSSGTGLVAAMKRIVYGQITWQRQ